MMRSGSRGDSSAKRGSGQALVWVRSAANFSQNARAFSFVSNRWPSEVIDTSSTVGGGVSRSNSLKSALVITRRKGFSGTGTAYAHSQAGNRAGQLTWTPVVVGSGRSGL